LDKRENGEKRVQLYVDIATKLGLLFIILYVSYLIVKPFLPMILWGIVLAVSLSPLIELLVDRFDNRRREIVIGVVTSFIIILFVPTWKLSDSLVTTAQSLIASVEKREIAIPAPPEKVKNLPIIGQKSYDFWDTAHKDLPKALKPFQKQIKAVVMWFVGMVKGAFGTVLMTMVSIIIAGAFLLSKDSAVTFYKRVMKRVVGDRGDEWAELSALTVRSVAMGVVGVGVIQSFFALIGMIFMGVPLAPVWAILIMFLTIIQLPALIVIGPMIAYVYSISSGTGATIFAIYMLVVGASDGVLKPILMGRGVDIPMLVILIGAIGGMILMGMLGLFLGAVILALTYKLFELWIDQASQQESEKL
jgi:predicted PurR-regulated permease PerM